MLISLTLHNFKKHEYLSVDFTGGTNGVYGPNYRGKTTILNGILFALGGTSHVPGKRLERRNSTGKFGAELTFSTAAGVFRVERNKTTANMFFEGNLIAAGITAVNDKVEEVIGQSVKEWKELHYAKQKNSHSLLRYSATNLQKLLRRLVGADDVDAVSIRLKKMAVRQEGLLEGLTGLSDEELLMTRIELDEYREAASREETSQLTLGLAHNKAKEDLAQASQANQLAARKVDSLESAVELFNRWKTKQTRLKAALETGTDLLDRRTLALSKAQQAAGDEIDSDIRRLEDLLEYLAEAALNKVHANNGLVSIDKGLEEALVKSKAASLAIGDADIPTEEAALDKARDLQLELKTAFDLANAKHKAAFNLSVEAVCPTCGTPVKDHDPAKLAEEVDKTEKAMFNAKNEHDVAVARVKDLAAKVDKLNRNAEIFLTQQNVIKDLEGKKAAMLQSVASAASTLEELLGEFNDTNEIREQKVKLEKLASDLRHAKKEHKSAVDDVEQAKAELEALVPPEDVDADKHLADARAALAKCSAHLATVTAKEQEAGHNLRFSKMQLTNLQGQVGNCMSKIEADEKVRARYQTGSLRLTRIDQLQKLIKEVAEGHMVKVWSNFMAHASRFANLCTGGDISALARDDEGNFTFIEDGEEMQLEEASGAQEAIIGLAVQLALASAAPCNLNVLLLDEPTADMDPDRSLATISALGALGQQIVFVSHHQTDNVVCSNAITL